MSEQKGTQALDRALDVLEVLGSRPGGSTVVEVAEATGLPRPTAHRLLVALARRNYARTGPGPSQYRLGFKLVEMASSVLASLHLRQEVQPHLRRLSEATGETVHLTVLEDGQVVYIDKVEAEGASIRMASRIGGRMPVHCTASGKVIMSLMGEAEVRQILQSRGMPRRTPNTITEAEQMLQRLQQVRQEGVAYDAIENEEGVICLAAAIRGHDGSPLGAISISGPAFRMTEQRLADLRLLVLECTGLISNAMGWRGGAQHGT